MRLNINKISHITVIFAFFVLTLTSCENKKNLINEGKITYNITYLTTKEEKPVVAILPKEMETFFSDNKTLTTIKGFFATFKLSFLTRPDIDRKFVIFRMFDQRYIYATSMNGEVLGTQEMGKVHVKLIDSTFMYKDLKSKLAKVYCPAISKDTFEIIYTTQINIKDPNASTPYSEIPGVMLKAKLKLFGVLMDIDLKKLEQKEIPPEVFDIPSGYQEISLDQMEELFKKTIQ